MTEYEELQSEIVKILDDYELNGLEEFEGAIHNDSLQKADLILSIIAERCVFLDKEVPGLQEDSDARWFWNEGWRPIKEIKKEAK